MSPSSLLTIDLGNIGHLTGTNQEAQKLGDREAITLKTKYPCLSGKSFGKNDPKMPDIADTQFHVS